MLGIRLTICPSFSCRQSQRPFSAKKVSSLVFADFSTNSSCPSVPALKRGSNNVLKRTLTNCFSSRPLFGLDKVFTEKQGNKEEDKPQNLGHNFYFSNIIYMLFLYRQCSGKQANILYGFCERRLGNLPRLLRNS